MILALGTETKLLLGGWDLVVAIHPAIQLGATTLPGQGRMT